MSEDRQVMEAANQRTLERVNSIPVSKDDLIEAVQEIGELEPGERDFTAHAITIVHLHPGDSNKAVSIMFRLEALAYSLFEEGAPGWSLPLPDGSVLAEESVFAAAAVHPVIDKGEHLSFERESFLQKVLELADLDKVG